jgi:DNA helicase-2/ATP-dependent DNA helicase PcrA
MQTLTLTAADERRRFGSVNYQSPSRFLDEIPDEWLEETTSEAGRRGRYGGRSVRSGGGSSLDYSYSQEPNESGAVPEGQRVRHAVFGDGTILQSVGSGTNTKLRIRFDRVGMKTIMVRYANLDLI